MLCLFARLLYDMWNLLIIINHIGSIYCRPFLSNLRIFYSHIPLYLLNERRDQILKAIFPLDRFIQTLVSKRDKIESDYDMYTPAMI